MRPDIILGVITLFIALVGLVITIWPLSVGWIRKTVGISLTVLGIIASFCVVKVSNDSVAAGEQLRQQVQKASDAANETTRLQGLNNALQQKLLELANVNAQLTKQGIFTVTGGDSFGYMDFVYDMGTYVVIFRQHGKYPVYDLHVRACDVTDFDGTTRYWWNVGEIQTGGNWMDQDYLHSKNVIPIFDRKEVNFDVYLSARNGLWIEKMQLRQVNGIWTTALAVWSTPKDVWSAAQDDMRSRTRPDFEKSGVKFVYQQIPKGFPVGSNKKVVWGP